MVTAGRRGRRALRWAVGQTPGRRARAWRAVRRKGPLSGLFLGRMAISLAASRRWNVSMAALKSQHSSGRLLAALDEMDLRALSRSLSDDLRARKVTFGATDGGDVKIFVVDPVPRVIERDEWDVL